MFFLGLGAALIGRGFFFGWVSKKVISFFGYARLEKENG